MFRRLSSCLTIAYAGLKVGRHAEIKAKGENLGTQIIKDFKEFDKDGDKRLDAAETNAVLRHINWGLAVHHLDGNKDGISFWDRVGF